MKPPLLLYLQVPFCATRCAFCRCVSAIPNDILLNRNVHDRYVDALIRNIRHYVPRLAEQYEPIGINWGGGTPTTLHPDQLRAIGAAFRPHWDLAEHYFSVEATADSVSPPVLDALREIGVNRLSIGAESFNEATTRQMGRKHTAADAVAAFDLARAAGFDRLSVDLVIGYPGETVNDTLRSVRTATSLGVSHIAAHVYSPVENTSLVRRLRRGAVRPWTPVEYDTGLAQIEAALTAEGYRNHEYFHWTRPPHDADYTSLEYYFGYAGDTFGFGSGAYSFLAPHGCLTTFDMPRFEQDPITLRPGPITLELALEKSLGCAGGLNYAAMGRMFDATADQVATHPIARALAALPHTVSDADGVRLDRGEYVRQYVQGVQQRMRRMAASATAAR